MLTRVATVIFVLTIPVWISLVGALRNPALGVSTSSRLAEWARGHGAGSLVVRIERAWYSHHQPKVGGVPAAGTIPAPGTKAPRSSAGNNLGPAHLPTPQPIVPLAQPAIVGEGVWHGAGRLVDGIPTIYEAFVRPDPVHTSLVAGIAWMDTKLLRATLYSGTTIPGGGPYAHTAPIDDHAARTLSAAFNAGFRMSDSNGGYFTDGRVVAPLRVGAASFVIYRNGGATVGKWGRDATLTSNVVAVRQNLDLLVDGARPVPGLSANDTTKWGFTLGNQVYVWRSGIGVTADGALVYVAGPGLNITTLADLLVRAGAVRAMELDINPDWVNFSAYHPNSSRAPASAADGTELLSNMAGGTGRYFEPWWSRDFFTMSVRP